MCETKTTTLHLIISCNNSILVHSYPRIIFDVIEEAGMQQVAEGGRPRGSCPSAVFSPWLRDPRVAPFYMPISHSGGAAIIKSVNK